MTRSSPPFLALLHLSLWWLVAALPTASLAAQPIAGDAPAFERGAFERAGRQLAGPANLEATLWLAQNRALPESTHSVRVTIRNRGSADATGFVNRIRLSADAVCDSNDDLLLVLTSNGIIPGGKIEFVRNLVTPPALAPTDYQVCWQVDADNEVIESDETDNFAQALLVVVPGLVMTDGFEPADFSAWSLIEL
jgi:hypothetical protein